MSNVINAPDDRLQSASVKVFLGGSIEMGKAENWQDRLANYFVEYETITFWNPRRKDWDDTWVQDPTEGTEFHEQVTWEMDAQDDADIIIYYFDPDTSSPITLLELGTYSHKGTVIVCCPDGYFRKGNVAMHCNRYGIEMTHTLEDLVMRMRESLL